MNKDPFLKQIHHLQQRTPRAFFQSYTSFKLPQVQPATEGGIVGATHGDPTKRWGAVSCMKLYWEASENGDDKVDSEAVKFYED